MTALYAVSTDPELRRELRGWLLARGANHGRRSRGKPTEGPAAAAADEGFAGWLVWVGSVLGELSDDERKQVAQVFFRRGGAAPTWQQRLDVEAFAAPIVRAWVAEQKRERGANERTSGNALHELVVCPASRRPPAAALQAVAYCTGTLYVALLMREGGSQQLKHLLAQHNFAPLTESAVFHALHSAGTSRALALVDALMTDEEAGDVALRALADARMNMPSRETADLSAVVGRIPQWWKLHPRRRGALLYVLAQLGKRQEGIVPWPTLSRFLGSAISAKEFAAFLDQGPDALWSVESIARGLSPGWQRAPIIVPRLERWLNESDARGRGTTDKYYATERVVRALCLSGHEEELAALRRFLRARFELRPSERSRLSSFVDKSSNRLCPAGSPASTSKRPSAKTRPAVATPSAKPPPVLFGD